MTHQISLSRYTSGTAYIKVVSVAISKMPTCQINRCNSIIVKLHPFIAWSYAGYGLLASYWEKRSWIILVLERGIYPVLASCHIRDAHFVNYAVPSFCCPSITDIKGSSYIRKKCCGSCGWIPSTIDINFRLSRGTSIINHNNMIPFI